jgi:hypothetical protein
MQAVDAAPPDAQLICPARYDIKFGNHSYVGIGFLSWQAAQTDCQNDGGNLIEVESAAEDAELKRQLEMAGAIRAWMGLRDPDNDGSYTWLDGSTTAQYANFDPVPGSDECVYIGTDAGINNEGGRWYTDSCNVQRVAVCECPGL